MDIYLPPCLYFIFNIPCFMYSKNPFSDIPKLLHTFWNFKDFFLQKELGKIKVKTCNEWMSRHT